MQGRALGTPRHLDRRLEEMEARIEELAEQVSDLGARLSAFEAPGGAGGRQPALSRQVDVPPGPSALLPAAPAGVMGMVSLLGRTLVVLGGAYLLRAITDASMVPRAGGVAAGLAYAAWWLVRSDRSAAAGHRLSSSFHGLAAAIIAFPMIAETTARFGVLPAPAGAAALVAFLALGLAVGLHRDLAAVGSLTTLFAVATALVLLVATHDLLPYVVTLLVIAAAVETLAFYERWLGLRWAAALALDLGAWSVAMVMARPGGLPEGYVPLDSRAAVVLLLLVPLLYAGSVAARTLVRGRPLTLFEGMQTCMALLLGLPGAASLGAAAGIGPAAGLAGLLLAVTGYVSAFVVLDPRGRRDVTFHFQATLAGVLLLISLALLLRGPAQAASLLALALTGLAIGSRRQRPVLAFHGTVYLGAAAWVTGVAASTADALLASPARPWRELSTAGGAVLLAAAVGYGLLAGVRPAAARWWLRLPHALVAVLLGCGLLAVAIPGLTRALGAAAGADAAAVATVRTALLAALALALAWTGRRLRLPELCWLVYPVLVSGGLKLLFEDIPRGRPATLFLSLTLYGGALLTTPRLLRRER